MSSRTFCFSYHIALASFNRKEFLSPFLISLMTLTFLRSLALLLSKMSPDLDLSESFLVIRLVITIFGRNTLLPDSNPSVFLSGLSHPQHCPILCPWPHQILHLHPCPAPFPAPFAGSARGPALATRDWNGRHGEAALPCPLGKHKGTKDSFPGEAQEVMGSSSDGFSQQNLLFRHILQGKAMETGPAPMEGGTCMCTCISMHNYVLWREFWGSGHLGSLSAPECPPEIFIESLGPHWSMELNHTNIHEITVCWAWYQAQEKRELKMAWRTGFGVT